MAFIFMRDGVNDCLDPKDICARENLSHILIVDVTFCIVWIRDR
jgi:hypothetical protein